MQKLEAVCETQWQKWKYCISMDESRPDQHFMRGG
jgi:hypothetical protein